MAQRQAALYLREAANLLDGHVEAEQVERLASHRRQVVHAQGLLLGERQVSIDPHLPLWLRAELVQPGDLLVSGGGGARLLRGGGKIRKWQGGKKETRRGVVDKAPVLPFWIRVWESRPLCCSFSEPGSFCPFRTLRWEPFLMERRGGAVDSQQGNFLRDWNFQSHRGRRHSPGVLLAMLPPIGYGPGPGPGPPWFIIPCMLFMPGPYGEPAPIMPWDMLG